MFLPFAAGIGTEKTVDAIEGEIRAIEEKCSDFISDTSAFKFDGLSLSVGDDGKLFGFTDTGLDQFGGFLGTKSNFFKKLKPETRKAVFDDVLAEAHEMQKESKVRLYDGNVRAFVSKTYTSVSNLMLVNEIKASEVDLAKLGFRCFTDFENTDLIVMSKDRIAVNYGESVDNSFCSGLIMRNNDVGKRAASIQCFLYNAEKGYGIIFGERGKNMFKMNHTKNVESKYAEAIVYCVRQFSSWFGDSGLMIKAAREGHVLDYERIVPVLRSVSMREKEILAVYESVAPSLENGSIETVWDLVRGISIYASSIQDRERTFELMEVCGDILSNVKKFKYV